MKEPTFSEINEGWLALCEEARDALYNRDAKRILLFKHHMNPVNAEALQECKNADDTFNEIESRMADYQKRYNF